ncbi:MAG: DUF835 domain-containing protein [Methanomassiliicoccales archaeon]
MRDVKKLFKISVVLESYPRKGFQMLGQLNCLYKHGLCITRLHPEYVSSKYNLKNMEYYWLSCCKGKKVISPKSISHMIRIIKLWLRKNGNSLVFMDGIEYLLIWNDLGRVMHALEEINAILISANSEMLICLDPLTLEQRDVEKIISVMDVKSFDEVTNVVAETKPQQISESLQENTGQTVEGLPRSQELHAIP